MIGILVFCLHCLILVSSNPITVQPCPVFQSPFTPNPVLPSNTNPYPSTNTAQNPIQAQTAFQDTLNQLLFTKILTNPSLQKILDPNTRLYNQNGNEISRQGVTTPNVVNNYFIVPPEFFSLNETIAKDGKVKNKPVTAKKKGNTIIEGEDVPEGTSKRKKKPKKRTKVGTTERASEKGDKTPKVDKDRNKKRKKPKSKARNKVGYASPVITDNIDEPDQKQTKKRKKSTRKQKEKEPSSEFVVEIPESAETIEIGVRDYALEDQTAKIRRSKLKKKENIVDKQEKNKKEDKKSDRHLKNIELPENCPERIKDPTENRKTRTSESRKAKTTTDNSKVKNNPNLNEAGNRQNNRQIAPIPEDMLKSFFPYMNYYNPNSNLPYNYDGNYPFNFNGNQPFNFNQMYQTPNYNNQNGQRNKKRRKNQNNTIEITLKPKKSKQNTTDTIKTEVNEDNITPIVTEEGKPDEIKEVTETPMILTETVKDTDEVEILASPEENEQIEIPVTNEKYSEIPVLNDKYVEILDDTTIPVPELGQEDIVPVIYNNGIYKDYYPIFYDDPNYSSEEDYGKRDDKYYYKTTDIERRTEPEFEAEVFKPERIEKIEKERIRTEPEPPKSEFKALENPDFRTKKVDFDDSLDLDKLSTYSDTKTPHFSNAKPGSEIRRVLVPSKHIRPQMDSVETVYARSKVKKYGVVSEETVEDTSASTISSEEVGEGTTYIVAKSLGHVDDYYF